MIKTHATATEMLRAKPVVEFLESRQLMAVVFGLQANNTLIAFDSATPSTLLATVRMKGLERGETLRGIDFRPANGLLYGLGTTDRLYTIDTATGAATAVSTGTLGVPLDINQEIGIDFNPVVDRLRIVTESSQNLRVDPNTGVAVDADPNAEGVQFDGLLTYDAGDPGAGTFADVLGVAYTNNDLDGATPTTLFGIDAARDVLVRHGSPDGTPVSPNAGTLFTVGALGADVLPLGGFDVETVGGVNTALAALSTGERSASQLYTINLDTGAATPVGNIGRGRKQTLGLAVAPQGTPFFVLTSRNELIGLNTATPGLLGSRAKITGFADRREKAVGIDFRPATGQLWVLTDAGRLYTLDTATAVATAIGGPSAVALETRRTSFGFDFNPSVDRIRVVNTAGQNLRFNPDTGAVVDFDPADPDTDPDTGLAYVPGDASAGSTPRIVGSAYSNNTAGGTPTTLFAIDAGGDVLATQGSAAGTPTSPNTGQLFTVGAAGVNIPDQAGFDILTSSGTDSALAVFAPGGRGSTALFSVNTITGGFTLLTNLNKKVKSVVGLAIRTGP